MLSLLRNSWERRAFRKMRSSAVMMKGGRRAVFCYGQRVWSKRIEFRRALTLLVEASAGECRIAKGSTTTRQARMQAYLGQASWQLRLVQHFGLKFCERATAVPSRAAVEPLVTKSDLDALTGERLCMCCPCLFSVQMYARLPHHKRLTGALTISRARKQTRLCPAAVSRLRTHQASR